MPRIRANIIKVLHNVYAGTIEADIEVDIPTNDNIVAIYTRVNQYSGHEFSFYNGEPSPYETELYDFIHVNKTTGTLLLSTDVIGNQKRLYIRTNNLKYIDTTNSSKVPITFATGSEEYSFHILVVTGNPVNFTFDHVWKAPNNQFSFTIDGNIYSEIASEPYKITTDETTDIDATKTPWVLVSSYIHKADTSPSPTTKTIAVGLPYLPTDGSRDFNAPNVFDTDQSSEPSWGHADASLLNNVFVALGSPSSNENGAEMRFIAKTSAVHNRVIHFKLSNEAINGYRLGSHATTLPNDIKNNSILYDDTYPVNVGISNLHTANLPRTASAIGDGLLAGYLFYQVGGGWVTDTGYWLVDDNRYGIVNDTNHQIWIRANYFSFKINGNTYSKIANTPYRITIDETTDIDSTKTPWVLVSNYIHKSNTVVSTTAKTIAEGLPYLPIDGSKDFNASNLFDTDQSSEPSWGHADADLLNKVFIALGSSSSNLNGAEMRFIAKTSGHTRVIHFKLSTPAITGFRIGVHVSTFLSELQNATLYDGSYPSNVGILNLHTAYLPLNVNTANSSSLGGYIFNYAATGVIENYWTTDYSRWEVDDNAYNVNDTYHQIWVRANKLPISWSGLVAFHHGNFDGDYGYETKELAAAEGHFFADTATGTYGGGRLTAVTSTTNVGTTYTWTPMGTLTCDVLMVAGGGGGGGVMAGGGGAGGLLFYAKEVIPSSTKTIVVGAGGLGGQGSDNGINERGLQGNNTSVSGLTQAIGGGGAAGWREGAATSGGSGGGGGGGVDDSMIEAGGTGTGTGVTRQGYAGGNGIYENAFNGGGGGAGGAGFTGIGAYYTGGNGGRGREFISFYTTKYGDVGWFASGGGGGGQLSSIGSTPGITTEGGGRGGVIRSTQVLPAMRHTGGGGGGSGYNGWSDARLGGTGGTGIVIIKTSDYTVPVPP